MSSSALVLAASKNGSSSTGTVVFLVILIVAVLVLVLARRRSRARMAVRMENSFVVGAEVVNRAGTIGVLRAIEDDEVLVEVAPGVQIRMLRASVFPRSGRTGGGYGPGPGRAGDRVDGGPAEPGRGPDSSREEPGPSEGSGPVSGA